MKYMTKEEEAVCKKILGFADSGWYSAKIVKAYRFGKKVQRALR